jgi:hypothetical protein
MAEPSDLRITITDVSRLYCARGAKAWAEGQGIDFKRFLREGIAADDLVATGDAMALRIVELKRREAGSGRASR